MGCVGECARGHFELAVSGSMTLSMVLGLGGALRMKHHIRL